MGRAKLTVLRITKLHLILLFMVFSGSLFVVYYNLAERQMTDLELYTRARKERGSERMTERQSEGEMERRSDGVTKRGSERVKERGRDREGERPRERQRRFAQAILKKAQAEVESYRDKNRDLAQAETFLIQARQASDRGHWNLVRDWAEQAIHAAQVAPLKEVTYVVRSGDSLWSIAKQAQHFSQGHNWYDIWKTNQDQIPDFDHIVPNQKLVIQVWNITTPTPKSKRSKIE